MLAIKCTPNIFLISVYVSRQQDIWYVKVSVLKNWKQLPLSVTYSVVIGAGVRYLFIFIPYLHNHEVPTKHAREKLLDPQNTHEKKSGPTKYPREKNSDSRNTREKNFWTHEGTMARYPRDPRWHETHGI